MAVDNIPAGGISLHGLAADMRSDKHIPKSAMLFKLSQSMLNDLKKAANGHGGVHLVTGKAPKLQLGSRSIDLSVSSDVFRNELYTSTSPSDFDFNAVISHRAEPRADPTTQSNTAGADAALAALQSNLASYEQEKKAKQTTISENVLPEYRNRFEAARKQKRGGLLGVQSSSGGTSPSLSGAGTPGAGLVATSAPTDTAMRTQAMRTPVIHLLAMKPATTDEIIRQTHIPRTDLEAVVSKVAQQADGKWELMGKVYKELDVWAFGYKMQDDRQMAIDNAIKALDRQRIGKEDKLWQMLLPKEERGKGKVLSRLHLGAGQTNNKGLTPNWAPSPNPQTEDDEKHVGAANTPRMGPSSGTPKTAAAKSNNTDMKKRLLSKDPKKARAAEEAKEKRKRDREAGASDREGAPAKRQKQAAATSKAPSKVKSAELVHSSDDEDDGEEGEIKETPSHATPKSSQPAAKTALKPRPKPSNTPSPGSSDDHVKKPLKPAAKAITSKPKASTPLTKTTASPALKPGNTAAAGKSTPDPASKATTASKQTKTQLSPSKSSSRPPVPSPLGAARPRLASDVSDRSGIGIRKNKPPGAETPKGLGITTAAAGRKRQDTVTSRESLSNSDASEKKRFIDKQIEKSRTAATSAATKTNGTPMRKPTTAKPNTAPSHMPESTGTKRKAAGTPVGQAPTPKHRKTDSSQPSTTTKMPATARASATTNGINGTSGAKPPTTTTSSATYKSHPSAPSPESSDASTATAASVLDTITFAQGVELARKFRDDYYPRYAKLYDSLAEKDAKGEGVSKSDREELMKMHVRLKGMKAEIEAASGREGV